MGSLPAVPPTAFIVVYNDFYFLIQYNLLVYLYHMKNLFILLALLVFTSFMSPQRVMAADYTDRFFRVQSIDTMKYSRDRARNEVTDVVRLDIDQQIGRIAATGATHIAVATPYD